MKTPAIVFALLLISGCGPVLLVPQEEFCDNYSADGCTSPQKEERTYRIDVPESKKGSWFDLSYYMYFHTRQTPGLRVELPGWISKSDEKILKETLRCEYRLYKEGKEVSGHIEGLRIDDDSGGFWCFDYLGTMLVSYHKKYGSIQEKPLMSFFPVHLELSYSSGLEDVNGSRKAEITVEW